jgi:hypothetical protein
MAEMESALAQQGRHFRSGRAIFAIAAGVLAIGAATWLWLQHGLAVYVTQAATFAWNCF